MDLAINKEILKQSMGENYSKKPKKELYMDYSLPKKWMWQTEEWNKRAVKEFEEMLKTKLKDKGYSVRYVDFHETKYNYSEKKYVRVPAAIEIKISW